MPVRDPKMETNKNVYFHYKIDGASETRSKNTIYVINDGRFKIEIISAFMELHNSGADDEC